jgi:hypothetical protein
MNELSIFYWTQFIAGAKPELETSKEFSERILSIISKQYHHISTKAQQDIVTLLVKKKCIPTRFGMKLPGEAYFPSVNLFDDLPILDFSLQHKNMNEAFLTALGVRKVNNNTIMRNINSIFF